ncbi:hypothetical protein ACUXST_001653 [Sphingomonas sp. F9_3S_D5_B_2]
MAERSHSRREFDRMFARHQGEIEQARREFDRIRRDLDGRLASLRFEMDTARAEIDRAIRRGLDPFDVALRYRDKWGQWPDMIRRKRRPPRGLEGGEPVPVEPRPKPKPLIDGAEAPVE